MIRAFPLNPSVGRRLLALSFCGVFTVEGVCWIAGVSALQGASLPGLSNVLVNYGPLNIFCAALVATDSSAIHRRNLIYRAAGLLKTVYLLFSSSISLASLARYQLCGCQQPWLVVRLVVTLLWISVSLEDLIYWRDQPQIALPGLRGGDDSSTSGSSAIPSDTDSDFE